MSDDSEENPVGTEDSAPGVVIAGVSECTSLASMDRGSRCPLFNLEGSAPFIGCIVVGCCGVESMHGSSDGCLGGENPVSDESSVNGESGGTGSGVRLDLAERGSLNSS
jgi:hypothetical protein